jgi:hypothetical protein
MRKTKLGVRARVKALVAALAMVPALAIVGCTTGYAADVRNATPQPLYVQVLSRSNEGTQTVAQARLGPGDRRGLGPFTLGQREVVWLRMDTNPNPGRPAEMTLRPGLSVVEVIQGVDQSGSTTAGPLIIRELGGGQ